MSLIAFDTSAAVPLLVRSHTAHSAVRRALGSRSAVLTAHSLAETYSVLTRLPGDSRVAPVDAARLIEANFGTVLTPDTATVTGLPGILAALGTYAAVGAKFELVGD